MRKEDKKLLLQDLCGRLPYRTKIQGYNSSRMETVTGRMSQIDIDSELVEIHEPECEKFRWAAVSTWAELDSIKPYLRPMESITEKEREEEANTVMMYLGDFFNSRYLDYHNLIKKGLALAAPEGMYDLSEL